MRAGVFATNYEDRYTTTPVDLSPMRGSFPAELKTSRRNQQRSNLEMSVLWPEVESPSRTHPEAPIDVNFLKFIWSLWPIRIAL